MGLQVIGAGFGRTGTLSLKVALEQIGFGPCHHMSELIKQKNTQATFFLDAGSVLGDGPEKEIDWDEVYGEYKAAVDFPTCLFYKQLMVQYPDAKVVLSVREPERWYESAKSTIYNFRSVAIKTDDPLMKVADDLVWKKKFQDKFDDKEAAIKIFNDHIEEVKKHVPEDRLLVFSVKEGWEPLCKFLDVPKPETLFPRINDRESAAKVTKQLSKEIEAGVKDLDIVGIDRELAKAREQHHRASAGPRTARGYAEGYKNTSGGNPYR